MGSYRFWILWYVWISLIAENWKYCSKIIFKYVNSVVGPSFKEKFAKIRTCGFREQCMEPTEMKCKHWTPGLKRYPNSILVNFRGVGWEFKFFWRKWNWDYFILLVFYSRADSSNSVCCGDMISFQIFSWEREDKDGR